MNGWRHLPHILPIIAFGGAAFAITHHIARSMGVNDPRRLWVGTVVVASLATAMFGLIWWFIAETISLKRRTGTRIARRPMSRFERNELLIGLLIAFALLFIPGAAVGIFATIGFVILLFPLVIVWAVIREFINPELRSRSKAHYPWECEHCRYDLRDLPGDRCPECGTQIR